MAQSRKYAGLPDLDSAPDIYETNDATLDGSTVAASTTGRSPSPSEDSDTNISRRHLQPSKARTHFKPAKVDARDVDFSDRIDSQRRSYRASWRRLRRGHGTEDEGAELGDFSDEEDEPLSHKLSRLRREMKDAMEEVRRRKEEAARQVDNAEEEDGGGDDEVEITSLCRMMEETRKMSEGLDSSATVELEKQLHQRQKLDEAGTAPGVAHTPSISQTASMPLSTPPTYTPTQALAKAASFDARLTLLENMLGLASSPDSLTNPHSNPAGPVSKPILQSLTTLEKQISLLADTPLDNLSRRVRQLAQETDKLEEQRSPSSSSTLSSTKPGAPRAPLPPPPSDVHPSSSSLAGDTARLTKINALYGALSTIEDLSPTLPVILERLRSLRLIHADAGTASSTLHRLEAKQADVDAEVRMWRAGLEKVERGVRNGEDVLRSNVKGLENALNALEERVRALS
ncbi:MAG: hypothetical protein M1838_002835 [Thelocarpon superellum]|nr:MAG: hypothetical protein M1838_002835 [Thelocarpon superellum]